MDFRGALWAAPDRRGVPDGARRRRVRTAGAAAAPSRRRQLRSAMAKNLRWRSGMRAASFLALEVGRLDPELAQTRLEMTKLQQHTD